MMPHASSPAGRYQDREKKRAASFSSSPLFPRLSSLQLCRLSENLAAFSDAPGHRPYSGPGPQPPVTWVGSLRTRRKTPPWVRCGADLFDQQRRGGGPATKTPPFQEKIDGQQHARLLITGVAAVLTLECPSDGNPFISTYNDQNCTKAFIGFRILKRLDCRFKPSPPVQV